MSTVFCSLVSMLAAHPQLLAGAEAAGAGGVPLCSKVLARALGLAARKPEAFGAAAQRNMRRACEGGGEEGGGAVLARLALRDPALQLAWADFKTLAVETGA